MAILRVMRRRFEVQLALGKTPIEKVVLPARSRDELPPVLAGLQWIFQTAELNRQIFELLEKKVVGGKKATGRPGLDLWHILVLGIVRLALDCDYDRLEHLANYDGLLRPKRTQQEENKRSGQESHPILHGGRRGQKTEKLTLDRGMRVSSCGSR